MNPGPPVCIACKQNIPKHESHFRDMRGVIACKRCYHASVSTAIAVAEK